MTLEILPLISLIKPTFLETFSGILDRWLSLTRRIKSRFWSRTSCARLKPLLSVFHTSTSLNSSFAAVTWSSSLFISVRARLLLFRLFPTSDRRVLGASILLKIKASRLINLEIHQSSFTVDETNYCLFSYYSICLLWKSLFELCSLFGS